MKKIKNFSLGVLTVIYAAALIYYSKDVSAGVIASVNVCLTSILPSLYPFMVLSGIIISSGLYRTLSRPFGFPARYILRVPEEVFSVFLLSCAAGYPVGAKMLSELYDRRLIDKPCAERLLGCCYAGGPAFFCGVAGTGIYGDIRIGLLIFLCVFISNLLTGAITALGSPVPDKSPFHGGAPEFTAAGLVSSLSGGGAGIMNICAAIVFFSSFTSVLSASGILEKTAAAVSRVTGICLSDCLAVLRSVLEISNISGISPDVKLLPAVTALLSFGGLCVVMQTEGIIGGRLSTNIFYLGRILSLFISYFCCKIVIYIMDIDKYIQASKEIHLGYRQNSPIPSVFLLIMTILLLSNNYIVKSEKI